MEDFENSPCLVCQGVNLFPYSSKGQFGLPTHVVICKDCGFSFLNPRWTIQRYNHFYAKEYDTFYRDETVKSPDSDHEFANIKAILKRFEYLEYELNPKTVLDIGCGMGHSLIYLKNNLFKDAAYHAIEPSETCISYLKSKGINVLTNDVFSDWNTRSDQKFDLVIMRHVLEHFNDPVEILKKVNSVLSDDGVLYLAVPDAMNPTKPLRTNYFRVVHVSYFSKKSLTNVLKLVSLNPVRIVEGDVHEKYEIFAFCKKSETIHKIDKNSTEWEKQKGVYDKVGKADFYYTQKSKLIRVLRKLKLLK
jgi:2-polyprenyl-3-methyl-5-hydroxy-6-metoxy-1,4-benzoquinol methylase